jgi:phosphoribosylanthranilate isomerase
MTSGRSSRTRVKICGITNARDAGDAVALGVDALGFNLYPGSKRFIDLRKESGWIRELPPFVTKVAVMVNPTIDEAGAVFDLPYIDMVQFHGHEDEKFCAHFARAGLPFIKAIAAKDEAALKDLERFGTGNILIDAYAPDAFGGTGRLIDFALLTRSVRDSSRHLILSGGLTASNVRAAIDRIRPYAVDVASGVEAAPGRKDKTLMAEFIRAAHGAGA